MDETAALPHVDEHSVEIDAPPARAWDSLLHVLDASFSSGFTPPFARVVGCADTVVAGPRPLAAGSTFPGFHVATATPAAELALAGGHRFSEYALIFRLDDLGGRTRLRAETRAEFPGLKGSVYRALVIGTRMHVLVTRRIVTAAKRNAERP